MNGMKLLRHKLTGIAGFYPAHFADFDYFEEVVDLEEPCTDCVVIDAPIDAEIYVEVPNEEEDEDNDDSE